jgi:hypothetical protein
MPSSIYVKRPTYRDIMMKFQNTRNKEKIIKTSKEKKKGDIKGLGNRMAWHFSIATMKLECDNGFKSLRKKKSGRYYFQPRILSPFNPSVKSEARIKTHYQVIYIYYKISKY